MTLGSPLVVMRSFMVLHAISVKLLSKIAYKNSPKLNRMKIYQTNCCSMTLRSPLVVIRSFVVLHPINVKLLSKIAYKDSPK